MSLEPGHHVRIQPKGNLLLHGPVEHAALGIRPIENLRNVGRVDLVVGKLFECLELLFVVFR